MNSKVPFFSVVIPVYNKEKYIEKTLKSVIEQVFTDFEVIIVDDGSTDLSIEKARHFITKDKRFTLYQQNNAGVSVARNSGIKNASGNFIALLDADDIWFSNHLKNIYNAIVKHHTIQVFCTNYLIENKKNKFKKTKFSYLPKAIGNLFLIENYFKSSLKNDIAWTSAVCIKKSLLITENYFFDPMLLSNQDTDLWIRLGLKHPFIFIHEATAIHKCYAENGLAKSKNIDNKYLLVEKYIDENEKKRYFTAYLDQNKFSIAIQYLKIGETKKAYKILKRIEHKNLSNKRRYTLLIPKFILSKLLFRG